ncbi:MAG: M15 family metallopeptidase [Eubacteriales bacterium]|nr:M15 family metallopeptidase [Eubacteriales bacterium]
MKKTVCFLMALVLCMASLCFPAIGEEATTNTNEEQSSVQDQQEEGPSAQETQQEAPLEGEVAEHEQTVSTTGAEPPVRWAYGISLTALQSPYIALVNADHPLEKGDVPDPLVKMTTVKRATSATINLQEVAAQAIEEMFNAALLVKEYTYTKLNKSGTEVEETATFSDGMILYLKSGYRSYGTQSTTYSNYLARNNNVDDGYVAKPGASEHQTGLCADILNSDYAGRDRMTQDFKYTPEAQWMKENCAEFGFILRFPEDKEEETGIKFEPWHFRYVGKEIAGYIQSTGMSFEAFTEEWQQALASFEERGGDIQVQLDYEDSSINAPPTSYILEQLGSDGDAEISLVF